MKVFFICTAIIASILMIIYILMPSEPSLPAQASGSTMITYSLPSSEPRNAVPSLPAQTSGFTWNNYCPVRGYVIQKLPTPPQFIVAAGDSVRRQDVLQGVVEQVPSPVTVQLCDSTGEWRYEYTTLPPLAVGDTVFFEAKYASFFYGKYYLPAGTNGLLIRKGN